MSYFENVICFNSSAPNYFKEQTVKNNTYRFMTTTEIKELQKINPMFIRIKNRETNRYFIREIIDITYTDMKVSETRFLVIFTFESEN